MGYMIMDTYKHGFSGPDNESLARKEGKEEAGGDRGGD